MPNYLYAAAVQGIQGFIFETDALREIAGASELVEQICTEMFAKQLFGEPDKKKLDTDPNVLVAAAGNIKYIFKDLAKAQAFMRNFPMTVERAAPGIQLSQVLLEIEDSGWNAQWIDQAEALLRQARNQAARPQLAWMGAQRTPKTGNPIVDFKEEQNEKNPSVPKIVKKDLGALKKEEAYQYRSLVAKVYPEAAGLNYKYPFAEDLDKLAKGDKSFLAVIHADGNDLGKIIQGLGQLKPEAFKANENGATVFSQFSKELNRATTEAAKAAFVLCFAEEIQALDKSMIDAAEITEEKELKRKIQSLPFRPIVLGGDDLTAICKAERALEFTEHFLRFFKQYTQEYFSALMHQCFEPSYILAETKDAQGKLYYFQHGLTACAGIAYTKAKFPFHYGVHLAEALCKYTKTQVKKEGQATPGALAFHKVQTSFVVDEFKDILKDELTLHGQYVLSRNPYLLEKQPELDLPTLAELKQWRLALDNSPSGRSRLRQFLSLLAEDQDKAKLELKRMGQILGSKFFEHIGLPTLAKGDIPERSQLNDLLSIVSLENPVKAKNQ